MAAGTALEVNVLVAAHFFLTPGVGFGRTCSCRTHTELKPQRKTLVNFWAEVLHPRIALESLDFWAAFPVQAGGAPLLCERRDPPGP